MNDDLDLSVVENLTHKLARVPSDVVAARADSGEEFAQNLFGGDQDGVEQPAARATAFHSSSRQEHRKPVKRVNEDSPHLLRRSVDVVVDLAAQVLGNTTAALLLEHAAPAASRFRRCEVSSERPLWSSPGAFTARFVLTALCSLTGHNNLGPSREASSVRRPPYDVVPLQKSFAQGASDFGDARQLTSERQPSAFLSAFDLQASRSSRLTIRFNIMEAACQRRPLCWLGALRRRWRPMRRSRRRPRKIEFAREFEPLLTKRCVVCHGAQQQMSGLRLDQKRRGAEGRSVGRGYRAGQQRARAD